MNKKFRLFFVLIILAAAQVSGQQTQGTKHSPSPNDTINNISADSSDEYEIVYEIDTVRHTTTIIDYDTIYEYETKITQPDSAFPDSSNQLVSVVSEPDTSRKIEQHNFSVGINISPFLFTNNFAGSDVAGANVYSHYRTNNEEPQPSCSIALLAKYDIKRWSIQSGVQYSLLKNKFNYPYLTETLQNKINWVDTDYVTLISDTIDAYYQIRNDTIFWVYVTHDYWDTVHTFVPHPYSDTLREDHAKTGVQYYRFLEIPLILGFEAVRWKHSGIAVNAGIIASMLIYRKGEVVSMAGAPAFTDMSDYPLMTFSFSGYAGLSWHYDLSEKTAVGISPYYIMGLSSILKKSFPATHAIDRKGISLSFKYRF